MTEEFECEECGDSFDTKRGLSAHKRQSHPEEENSGKEETQEEDGYDTIDFSLSMKQALLGVFILGIAVGFLGGAASPVEFTKRDAAQQQPSNTDSAPSQVDTSKIDLEGEPSMGDKDAPVTVVEYVDYQCPFCKRFSTRTLPRIEENYIETGKVRYVMKDFPVPQLGHNRAIKMAKAANCAQEQGMYWEVHDKFMEEQNDINPRGTAKFDSSKIEQWVEEVGLDMTEYNTCMDETSNEEIDGDKQEGSGFDVKVNGQRFVGGTPSFVIYGTGDGKGEPVVGAQPYSVFESKIEEQLNS